MSYSNQEYLKEIEEQQQQYEQQIALRDKLITRLLAETEPLCEECVLKTVCVNGAKYETCARGLLATIQKDDKDEVH